MVISFPQGRLGATLGITNMNVSVFHMKITESRVECSKEWTSIRHLKSIGSSKIGNVICVPSFLLSPLISYDKALALLSPYLQRTSIKQTGIYKL